mgnify:CR=1 FL=1
MKNQNIKEEIKIVEDLFSKLFPICRSITGKGVKESLKILQEKSDFSIKQIKSGTKCFDWIVPDEWNINDAYIQNSNGEKIIDFKENNLHVISYSIPVQKKMRFSELKSHLHSLEDIPNAIPYRTSYYKKNWGFCIKHDDLKKFNNNDEYNVVIDSSLNPGNLTYGEYQIKGELDDEIVFSTYCCHPSMGNDNLSGMILWILLLDYLKSIKTKFSYRFIIAPETIGVISYLSKNKDNIKKVFGGYELTCVAGPNEFVYNSSFKEEHLIDKIAIQTLQELNMKFKKKKFKPIGSDERQYSSPGFRIPIGLLCKDQFHDYNFYHTSLDNLDFVSSKSLLESYTVYTKIIKNLENSDRKILRVNDVEKKTKSKFAFYITQNPNCEPMLSKRNLYPELGGRLFQPSSDTRKDKENYVELLISTLFYSDGNTSIEEISLKTGFSELDIEEMSEKLILQRLLERLS